MKKNIFLFEKNQLFKIEKDKITFNMDELVNHYHSIFNRPLNCSEVIKNRVNDEILDLVHVNFDAIKNKTIEFKYKMKLTKSSNVCENDGVSPK
jgi:hypothetical protein